MTTRTARILVCDRCAAETEAGDDLPAGWEAVEVGGTSRRLRTRYDACPPCAKALRSWIKGGDGPATVEAST